MKLLNKLKNLFGRCEHDFKFLQIEMNENNYKPEVHLVIKEIMECCKCGHKRAIYRYEKV